MYPSRKAKQRGIDSFNYYRKNKDKEKAEETIKNCVICLDVVEERGVLTTCTHWFCFICIYEWSKRTNTCPLCKKKFRIISKKTLGSNGASKIYRIKDKDQSYQNESLIQDDYDVAMGYYSASETSCEDEDDSDFIISRIEFENDDLPPTRPNTRRTADLPGSNLSFEISEFTNRSDGESGGNNFEQLQVVNNNIELAKESGSEGNLTDDNISLAMVKQNLSKKQISDKVSDNLEENDDIDNRVSNCRVNLRSLPSKKKKLCRENCVSDGYSDDDSDSTLQKIKQQKMNNSQEACSSKHPLPISNGWIDLSNKYRCSDKRKSCTKNCTDYAMINRTGSELSDSDSSNRNLSHFLKEKEISQKKTSQKGNKDNDKNSNSAKSVKESIGSDTSVSSVPKSRKNKKHCYLLSDESDIDRNCSNNANRRKIESDNENSSEEELFHLVNKKEFKNKVDSSKEGEGARIERKNGINNDTELNEKHLTSSESDYDEKSEEHQESEESEENSEDSEKLYDPSITKRRSSRLLRSNRLKYPQNSPDKDVYNESENDSEDSEELYDASIKKRRSSRLLRSNRLKFTQNSPDNTVPNDENAFLSARSAKSKAVNQIKRFSVIDKKIEKNSDSSSDEYTPFEKDADTDVKSRSRKHRRSRFNPQFSFQSDDSVSESKLIDAISPILFESPVRKSNKTCQRRLDSTTDLDKTSTKVTDSDISFVNCTNDKSNKSKVENDNGSSVAVFNNNNFHVDNLTGNDNDLQSKKGTKRLRKISSGTNSEENNCQVEKQLCVSSTISRNHLLKTPSKNDANSIVEKESNILDDIFDSTSPCVLSQRESPINNNRKKKYRFRYANPKSSILCN